MFQSSNFIRKEEGTQSALHDGVDPSSNSVSRNPKFLFGLGGLRDGLYYHFLSDNVTYVSRAEFQYYLIFFQTSLIHIINEMDVDIVTMKRLAMEGN